MMERDDTMRKAGNQEGSRYQEAITRLASSVIFAARSEASVYQGGRSNDSLGQVPVFRVIISSPLIPDCWVTYSVSLPFLPSCLPHSFWAVSAMTPSCRRGNPKRYFFALPPTVWSIP